MTSPGGGLEALLAPGGVVVCCGSGGVGKTTTSAALGVEAARRGMRACVVTIDPAKRLADALGLDALGDEPQEVAGPWRGSLWALMLDTKSTFDRLVRRYAGTPEQAERILANRLYRNLSAALSGTQEYMAMEKLYELYRPDDDAARFDLIVVDTPPTRNALDFLDAPRRITRFLDNRFFRLLVMPTRAYVRALSVAAQAFVRTVARVVGTEVVDDAIAFFQAFEGMEQGFRDRAQHVLDLLAAESTSFVVVASPRSDTVTEALFFADRLIEDGYGVDALVVNRMHPRFGGDRLAARADAERERARSLAGTALGGLYENLAEFRDVAEREEDHLAELRARTEPAPVARVPILETDVHDLDGLVVVAGHLFGAPAGAEAG